MPYTTQWYIKNQIVHCRYEGIISLDDIKGATQTASDLVSQAVSELPESDYYRIHMVIDNTAIDEYEANVAQILRYLRTIERDKRHVGYLIIITGEDARFGRMTQFISTLAGNIFDARMRFFPRFEDGIAFLNEFEENMQLT